jgi:WD40 repeat protein
MRRRTLCLLALTAFWAQLAPAGGGASKGPDPTAAKEAAGDRPLARLGEPRFRNFGRPFALAFSPDGKRLAVASWDGSLTWWDVAARRPLRQWEAHLGPVSAVAVAPDGRSLASAGRDGEIRIWGSADGKLRRALAVGQTKTRGLTFSPDGKLLASADGKGVRLWDLGVGRARHTFPGGHAPAFSADGSTLLLARFRRAGGASAPDGAVLRVDVATGKERQRLEIPAGPGDFWEHFALACSGQRLVRGGFSPLRLRDLRTGRERPLAKDRPVSVSGLALSPDERVLVVASADRRLLVIELATGRVRRQFRQPGHAASAVAVSPDGRLLASGERDCSVLLWDLTGRLAEGEAAPVGLADPPTRELRRLSGGRRR